MWREIEWREPMTPTPNSSENSVLVFGAHPDDIEFGCGAVIAREVQTGRSVYMLICSKGEAGTSGSAEQRAQESLEAARVLGAQCQFVELDGDAKLQLRNEHTMKIARIIRQIKPATVLATSRVDNQHPDHARLGQIVRDASRAARYGGLADLIDLEPHTIEQLFYYAVTPDGEPKDELPILIDISAPEIISSWTAAMNAHQSQAGTRNYIDLQLTRARLWGARAGVEYAAALFSNDPLIFYSLSDAGRGVRHF